MLMCVDSFLEHVLMQRSTGNTINNFKGIKKFKSHIMSCKSIIFMKHIKCLQIQDYGILLGALADFILKPKISKITNKSSLMQKFTVVNNQNFHKNHN